MELTEIFIPRQQWLDMVERLTRLMHDGPMFDSVENAVTWIVAEAGGVFPDTPIVGEECDCRLKSANS